MATRLAEFVDLSLYTFKMCLAAQLAGLDLSLVKG